MLPAMRDPASPRVFLSYSRKDGLEFARRLQAMLEAERLSLYRDLSNLDGGEDWWRQSRDRDQRASNMSCCCSRLRRFNRATFATSGAGAPRR
jgi:hypothetical protein